MKTHNWLIILFLVTVFGLMPCGQVMAEVCVLAQSPVFTITFGVETDNPDPTTMTTVPRVHTDIEIPLRFFDWDVHIKTDSPQFNTRLETEAAFFRVGSEDQFIFHGSIPSGWEFVGAEPDQIFWMLEESDFAPGFDSQDMTTAEVNALCLWNPQDPNRLANSSERWLRVHLVEVRGPEGGHVSMWDESGTGLPAAVFFSTFDGGIADTDVYYIPAKIHTHKSWGFTKPGVYEVDMRVTTFYRCSETLIEDRNGNCRVNLEDFALLAAEEWLLNDLLLFTEQWLECGSPFASECP